ncbi:Glycosyltransferases, probably involved in cell wall biogenesis [Cellulosimicrobium cellulans J34]|nr:Glycosyltransferases, probably involved in cell wall biogenesis [Cellulosimicrobium cellulans J34]SMF26334.1 Glycosyltransferases, probably involved in cell wall biogenesis [Cellulosimicrobium cellulans J1]
MMSVPPVVSVVVPAFDAAATLGEQLEALAQQVGAPAFEVLLCDNGSRDATADVARGWRDKPPTTPAWSALRLVDASARRGPSAARNVGAAEARGTYLAFCDADDVAAPDWVAATHAALLEHPMVAGPWDLTRLNTHYAHVGDRTDPTFRMAFWDELPTAGAGNLALRADVFAEVGGFDETLPVGEDIDLCWRVQLAGHALGESDAVMHVRMRTDLRSVFRQAYTYGRADRQLAHKYAALAASRPARAETGAAEPSADGPAATPDAPAPPRVSPPSVVGPVSRALRKLARVRRPSDLTYAVRRLGRWAGSRFGRVDRSLPRLERPPTIVVAEPRPADRDEGRAR